MLPEQAMSSKQAATNGADFTENRQPARSLAQVAED